MLKQLIGHTIRKVSTRYGVITIVTDTRRFTLTPKEDLLADKPYEVQEWQLTDPAGDNWPNYHEPAREVIRLIRKGELSKAQDVAIRHDIKPTFMIRHLMWWLASNYIGCPEPGVMVYSVKMSGTSVTFNFCKDRCGLMVGVGNVVYDIKPGKPLIDVEQYMSGKECRDVLSKILNALAVEGSRS